MTRFKRKKSGVRAAAAIMAAMIMMAPATGMSTKAADTEASETAETSMTSDDAVMLQEENEQKNDMESTAGGTTAIAAVEEPVEDQNAGSHEEAEEETIADPETSVKEALDNKMTTVSDDDILRISLVYVFDDGSYDEWMRGTGFVVGSRYILTRQSLIDKDSESTLYARILAERGEEYEAVGVNLRETDETIKHLKVKVNDRFGNEIEISDTAMKSGLGLIVTKKVIDTPACVFADISKISLSEGTTVHAKTTEALPEGAITSDEDNRAGNGFSVKTYDGTVFIDEKQAAGFAFSMDTTGGAPIGAPVYDDEGHVIGLIAGDAEDKTSYSAKALEAFLSMNGVEYRSIEQIRAESSAQQEEQAMEDMLSAELDAVDKTGLQEVINKASGIDPESYTEESVSALDESLKKAKDIVTKDGASQEEVDEAARNLESALDGMKKKGFMVKLAHFMKGKMITVISVAVAAVIIAIMFFLKRNGILTSIRRKNEQEEEEESNIDYITEEDDLLYAADNDFDLTYREKGKGNAIPKAQGPSDLPYAKDNGDTEATNLADDDGSSDTTLLTNRAYLVRTDTGKKIQITKNEFRIGKLKGNVDYCISGDPTISKVHCQIKKDGEKYYLEDLRSTNYTYYEGRQLPEYNPVQLEDGNIFQLSNIEFEFHKS